MMIAASCKFDDGRSYPTKCFPGRTLRHSGKEGSGHWLVAYREAEEHKYRNVHRRREKTYRNNETNSEAESPCGKTLNRHFLLHLYGVDKLSELHSIDISEQTLISVSPEDMKIFENISFIDASVNSLSLESFSSFVSLRELDLSLNGLCNMTFQAADFPHLQVLDLSYNTLQAKNIVSIGHLPCLKVLHLTGNQLYHLPPDLGSSIRDATQQSARGEDTQFKALEVLVLDNNKLSSGVFNSLANLKRLQYLNLQGNLISEIPYLQPLQTCVEEEAEEEGLASIEPDPDTDEHVSRISQICKGSSLPLPELQFLNLADNKITAEDAVMAAALFPMLREIDICSNPLTTQRRGDPPLLTHYLQVRQGIKVKRKKQQEAVRLPLRVSTEPKWKLEERISKVSKKSSMMAAPYPEQVKINEPTGRRTPDSEGNNTCRDNPDYVFLTQATDDPESKCDFQADRKITAKNKERSNDDTFPTKFTSYEMLMDEKSDPHLEKPIGIQTAVRMLEHTLRNLNVYTDSKPQLDCIQTPCGERQNPIKELPPLRAVKQPAERVDEMIKELTETSAMRQVTLSRAIHSTSVEKQEALLLLKDLEAKYQMLHKKSTIAELKLPLCRRSDLPEL